MSTPKDITLYLETDAAAHFERAVAACGALAERWQGHLNIAFVPKDIVYEPYAGFARGSAIADISNRIRELNAEAQERLKAVIGHVTRRFEFSCELRDCASETGETLMLHARHASLAVLLADRRPERPSSALSLSEDVIFASGRPTLLLPRRDPGSTASGPSGETVETVVVGWNASREATRAIADAMPVLRAARSVHLVVVPEAKIARLLGQEPGMDISLHLARNGVSVSVHRLEAADAGQALLNHARSVSADLVVMGAYGQPRVSEFIFGSATRTILDTAELPILFSR